MARWPKPLFGVFVLAFLVSTSLPCLPEMPNPPGSGPAWHLHVDAEKLSPTANCRSEGPAHLFFEAQCPCGCTRGEQLIARAALVPLATLEEPEPDAEEPRRAFFAPPSPEFPSADPMGIDHVPLSLSV